MRYATCAVALLGLATPLRPAQDPQCEPALAGATTTCSWVTVEGRYRVRSIITRPTEAAALRLPAVLFVQWLSCDPVTVTPDVSDGWQDVLRALIQRSGMVVMRTEKPGLGGSGGPACDELGYDEEVSVHLAALAQLRRSAGVDPDSIFIFGGSMGGTIAPLLAAGRDSAGVRGVIVAGTTAGTWLEHMIALDRRVMEQRGLSADSVHILMPEHIRFHSAYLAEGRPPGAVVADWSGGRSVWRRMIGTDTLLRHQYGRPARFHQEAQRRNWPAGWSRVRAPVLVIQGEYDWIMPEEEHRRITRSLSPGVRTRATYLNVPRMGHDFLLYPSPEAAFAGTDGRFDPAISDTILGWLRGRRQG